MSEQPALESLGVLEELTTVVRDIDALAGATREIGERLLRLEGLLVAMQREHGLLGDVVKKHQLMLEALAGPKASPKSLN